MVQQPGVNLVTRGLAALIAAGLTEPEQTLSGFTLWEPLRRTVLIEEAGEAHEVQLRLSGANTCLIDTGGDTITAQRSDAGWTLNGQRAPEFAVAGDDITVFADYGRSYRIIDPLARDTAGGADATLTLAPMPGQVVSVHVSAGEAVSEGDKLAVLEAMKMEHTMLAGRDGVIAEVLVSGGDQVEAGAPLIRLEDEAEG